MELEKRKPGKSPLRLQSSLLVILCLLRIARAAPIDGFKPSQPFDEQIHQETIDDVRILINAADSFDSKKPTLLIFYALPVGNSIEHRSPPCRKSNLTAPTGGLITIWAPSADVTIEANRQWDTDGIQFAQGHSARTPTCPTCFNNTTIQTALEIRGSIAKLPSRSSRSPSRRIRNVSAGSRRKP